MRYCLKRNGGERMKLIRTTMAIITMALLCLAAFSCSHTDTPMPESERHNVIYRRPIKDKPERTLKWDAYEEDLDGCWSYRDGDFESILKFDGGRLIVFNGRYGEDGEYTSDGYSGSAEYYLTDGGISVTDGDGNDYRSGYYSAVINDGMLEITLIDGDEITGSAHDNTVSYTRTEETPYVVIGIDRTDETGRSRISLPSVLNPQHESSADFVRLHATLVNEAVANYERLTRDGGGMIWLTRLYRDDRYIQALTWKYDSSQDKGRTTGIDAVVYDTVTRSTLTIGEIIKTFGISDIDAESVSAAVIRGDVTEVYVIEDGSAYFYRYRNGKCTDRGEMYETFDGDSDGV